MGGKGQRRREKNYLAAHGGNARLPPPPNEKEHDALPSKLRKILQLKNYLATKHESSGDTVHLKLNDSSSNKGSRPPALMPELGEGIMKTKNNLIKAKSASADASSVNTNNKKRKRKTAKDLRFEDLNEFAKSLKKKDRKKLYLKEKRNKRKKVKETNELDFPGRENIRFGEVVKAPPKLSFSKVPKSSVDASTERLRVRAIELYRFRRAWGSRPGGAELPHADMTSTF